MLRSCHGRKKHNKIKTQNFHDLQKHFFSTDKTNDAGMAHLTYYMYERQAYIMSHKKFLWELGENRVLEFSWDDVWTSGTSRWLSCRCSQCVPTVVEVGRQSVRTVASQCALSRCPTQVSEPLRLSNRWALSLILSLVWSGRIQSWVL